MLTIKPQKYPVALWGLRVMIPLIPIIMFVGLIRWQWNASIPDFRLVWSDEILNWHQVGGFRDHGFDTGYYSIWETAAPAAFTHFHVHGPWYPAFYGTFARFLAWNAYTGVVLNSLLITVAFSLFVWGTRLNTWQTLALGSVLVAAYPVHIYISTNMQESFIQAIAVVIAMIFYVALSKQEHLSPLQKIGFSSILFMAAITRMSWIIMLLPFLLLICPKTLKGFTIALTSFMVLGGVSFAIVQLTTPPGNHAVFATLNRITTDAPTNAIQGMLEKFHSNLAMFLNPRVKPRLDTLQTALVLIIVGVSVAMTVWNLMIIRGWRDPLKVVRSHRWHIYESVFHFYNLVAIIALSMMFYIIGTWGDYRVIFTHLLITLLLLILYKRYWLVVFFVVCCLLVFNTFLTEYSELVGPKYLPAQNITAVSEQFHALVTYDETAPTAWCNTVVLSINQADLIPAFPLGIGTSIFFRLPDQPVTLKSQYFLLIDQDYATLMAWNSTPNLELLHKTESIGLYRNLDADCDK